MHPNYFCDFVPPNKMTLEVKTTGYKFRRNTKTQEHSTHPDTDAVVLFSKKINICTVFVFHCNVKCFHFILEIFVCCICVCVCLHVHMCVLHTVLLLC